MLHYYRSGCRTVVGGQGASTAEVVLEGIKLSPKILEFYTQNFGRNEVSAVASGGWALPAIIAAGEGWSIYRGVMNEMKRAGYEGDFQELQSKCKDIYNEAQELKKTGYILGRVSGRCTSKNAPPTCNPKFFGRGASGDRFCGSIDDTIMQLKSLHTVCRAKAWGDNL